MNRTKNILFNITFAVNCLLVFLLFFESRIVLPSWLQVAGRMHPMILHFPIVFIVSYALYVLLIQKKISPADTAKDIGEWLLLVSAFASAITALMGLFLSREEGYDAEALLWHKWSGVVVSLLMLSWYGFRNRLAKTRMATLGATLVSFAAIIFTGHQGAGITHGQNFLLAPILPEKKQQQPLLEDAVVFTHMVQPILKAKCLSCHNSKKAKGELVMETRELLIKGGKNGKLWDSTEADFGLLMKRIHLPMEARKHMPPQGKPQLTADEMETLNQWIKNGTDFNVKVIELQPDHPLRKIAENIFSTIETDEYDFAAADESKVKSLNKNYRIVYPLAKNSLALGAEFLSPSQFKSEDLKELLDVQRQLVSLNLDKMPVKDEDLKIIGQFRQLRKLNLSFTNITGKTINELNGLKELKQLSLSGTKINHAAIKDLSSLKQLSKLFIWNTGLTADDVKQLQTKNLLIETGFRGDTIMLKLTPPILQNEQNILVGPVALKLKHYINGVSICYTLDGSTPDSIHSPVYNNNVTITGNDHLRAIAYKPGWYSSDTTKADFYAAKYKPDSLVHLLPPDHIYRDEKSRTLIDLVKSDNNYSNGKWVGFNQNSMAALLVFNQVKTISSVRVSSLIDLGNHLLPPTFIEVWGGPDTVHLKLLKRITPEQPLKATPPYGKIYELSFEPVSLRYLKIIAPNIEKMPKWHPDKGKGAWFFTDELFVN